MARLTRFATQRSTGHIEEYLRIFSATKRIAKRVREVGSSPKNNITCSLITYVFKADSEKHQLAPVRKVIHRYTDRKTQKEITQHLKGMVEWDAKHRVSNLPGNVILQVFFLPMIVGVHL